MNCQRPEIGDLFPFYVNGNVTPDQRRDLEDHVSHCSECQEELRFFLALQDALDEGSPHAPLKSRTASA